MSKETMDVILICSLIFNLLEFGIMCYLVVILVGRTKYFEQFIELLNSVEHLEETTRAVQQDWERRGEGHIDPPTGY